MKLEFASLIDSGRNTELSLCDNASGGCDAGGGCDACQSGCEGGTDGCDGYG